MKKKIILSILLLVFVFVLGGCGQENEIMLKPELQGKEIDKNLKNNSKEIPVAEEIDLPSLGDTELDNDIESIELDLKSIDAGEFSESGLSDLDL